MPWTQQSTEQRKQSRLDNYRKQLSQDPYHLVRRAVSEEQRLDGARWLLMAIAKNLPHQQYERITTKKAVVAFWLEYRATGGVSAETINKVLN
jgi:hypothetical protein